MNKIAHFAVHSSFVGTTSTYMECADVLRMRNLPVVYPEVKHADGERYHYLRDRTKK